jgi:cytoskeleton protein RodZ
MKSVGKQLQEARQAKNWTPELAARETKIKVDRILDLEADDYGHFSSPTYARGFVRTYARALGIDEYRLLRQLDNKLPEDDNATFVQDAGLPYVPETSQMVHASSSHRTGLYVFVGLAVTVLVVSAFVVFQAYRAGELPRYFANTPDNTVAPATNAAPVADADAETPQHALPVDPNDTSHAPKALPVDLGQVSPADTNSAPATPAATPAPPTVTAAVATPAPPAAGDSDTIPGAPRALPVDLSQLNAAGTNGAVNPAGATSAPVAQPVAPAPAAVVAAVPATPVDAAPPASPATANDDTTHAPRALPVDLSQLAANNPAPASPPPAPAPAPAPDTAATGAPTSNSSGQVVTPVDITSDHPVQESMAEAQAKKQLVLTASRDSFIRVTEVDNPQNESVLYASVLRAGQSVALSGRKFSVNVGIPSAVDIALDGVNYGPHSEGNSPETFTIESHQP